MGVTAPPHGARRTQRVLALDHVEQVPDLFGGKTPDVVQTEGEASWWDTLHPSRAWAVELHHAKTQEQALESVARFFAAEVAVEPRGDFPHA